MAITDPTDIASCVAWKEARETSTITIDGSNNVTQFDDQVTTNHYTDIIGTPKSGTRTHNGHNVIDFDGSSLVGEYGAAEQTQPVSVSWCGFSDNTYAASTAVVLGSARINDLGIGISNGNWAIRIGATFYETSVAVVAGTFTTMTAVFNDTSTVVYVNGSDVTPAGIPTFTDRWRDGGIGAASTVTASPITTAVSYYDGVFCEYCAHDAALTSTNATDIHNYFTSNWAASGVAVISATTTIRAGEPFDITVDDSTGATGATYDGTALTSFSIVNGTTVRGTAPVGGRALNASYDVVVTNGSGPSAGFSAAYNPRTGYAAFTLAADSSTFTAGTAFYNVGAVTTDQIEYKTNIQPADINITAVNDTTGVTTLDGVVDVDSTSDYYIWDASDTYSVGTAGTVTWQESVAPTISTMVIDASGNLVVTLSETVTAGLDGFNGFTVTGFSGGAVTFTYSSGDTTSALTLTASRSIYSNEGNGTGAYTQPGDGVQDESALNNVLASDSGVTVTNNSALVDPSINVSGIADYPVKGFIGSMIGNIAL